MYINIEPLCCIPETSILLYVSYTSIKKCVLTLFLFSLSPLSFGKQKTFVFKFKIELFFSDNHDDYKDCSCAFACFEDTLSRMLFGWQQQFSPCEKKSETKSSFNGTGSSTSKPVANASDKVKKKHSKKTE